MDNKRNITGNDDENRALLEHTLDVYGSDLSRWPTPVRQQLARIIEEDPRARRLVAETRALDRLLDQPLEIDRERIEPLTQSIISRIANEPGVSPTAKVSDGSADASVIPWPGPRKPMPATPPARTNLHQPGGVAGALALLAASLMIGVFAGSSDFVKPIAQRMADRIGIVAAIDPAFDTLIDEAPELTEWEIQ